MFKLSSIAAGVKRVVGRFKQALVPTVVDGPKPSLFLGQHTNPTRNAERRRLREIGHRQYKLRTKALRRLARIDRELGLA